MWNKDFVNFVVRKYLLGSPIIDICILAEESPNVIHEIIDTFLRSEGVL